MRSTRAISLSTVAMLGLLISTSGLMPANAATQKADQGTRKPATTARFSLDQTFESSSDFALILADGEETSVSGNFFIDQLYTFRDLLLEARKFALTEEAVGKDEPIITRISNKQEPAFAIDVSKQGNQSQFFVTIKTLIGQLTVYAGAVNRNDKREDGLFFEMSKRVQLMITKSTGQVVK